MLKSLFFDGKNRRPYVRIHMDGNSIPRSHSTRSTTEDVNSIQDIYASNSFKNRGCYSNGLHMIYHYVQDINRIYAIYS